ncbi:LLM class flavin-dependent oxidoreductase [Amnibacterium kyonggiense]|uniref:Alkanesulfonate monooxygenase SsuD/methylene tetrahydromethanopterin reductase-like flavin-dependent oxidoreductase (Luciferase family) n=1 Tax=Amnibacterium kyonggiense TaxID=595671 RepID=A0A4R7FRX8_9MICO|nr:LLM class flavin-dependent oxidoreductase [Amnibacterium kyonggiense]TDS80419.1 alkanesulfonate monooxygenase SsuD/methylene tetrahydromethanopterin reductase-like flavin-dependent oxidoreductase (luciferase family) [Amnibacterium kyonggiense]
MASLGIIFQPSFPPERLRGVAQRAEAAGIEELWVFEDCFRESGIAALVAALAATERLRIGVGILPMPLRNVAITAMELATIDRLFPGRARFGVGHGVLDWMGQVGRRVASPLTLMREYVPALRALLAGEEVSVDGRYVHLDRVRLSWPPQGRVPVLAAGEGPKTLALTGEVADGTVLTTGTSPAMTRDALQRIRDGRDAAGRDGEHEVVVFVNAGFGPTAATDMEAEFDRWGFEGERRVAATGDHDEVASVVREFLEAGAGTVLLQSRSEEPDLDAWIDDAGAVAARLR